MPIFGGALVATPSSVLPGDGQHLHETESEKQLPAVRWRIPSELILAINSAAMDTFIARTTGFTFYNI